MKYFYKFFLWLSIFSIILGCRQFGFQKNKNARTQTSTDDIKYEHFLKYCLNTENIEIEKTVNTLKSLVNKKDCFEAFTALNDLKKIEFKNHNLIDLKPISGFANLIELNLSNNPLTSLSDLKSLPNLKNLYARNTNLKSILPNNDLLKLTLIDLGKNELSDLDFLSNLSLLDTLYLEGATIGNWAAINSVASLKSLYLKNSNFPAIHLGDLQDLFTIDLSNTSLSNLEFLENNTKLKTILISNNYLPGIKYLENLNLLERLDLSSNQIDDIYPLKELKYITSLEIKDNPIFQTENKNFNNCPVDAKSLVVQEFCKDIANGFIFHCMFSEDPNIQHSISVLKTAVGDQNGSCSEIYEELSGKKTLDLENRNLVTLLPLENLTNLEYLLLANNNIQSGTPLSNLKNLIYVDLKLNPLVTFPKITNFPNLLTLDLSSTKINSIIFLTDSTHPIENLIISNNNIENIKLIENLPNLLTFEANECNISDFSAISLHSNLINLSLEKNNISNFPDSISLPELERLHLGDNKLSNIASQLELPKIYTLSLRKNEIEDVSAIKALDTLNRLDLSHNQIETIESLRNSFKNLVEFNIQENPLGSNKPKNSTNCPDDAISPVIRLWCQQKNQTLSL